MATNSNIYGSDEVSLQDCDVCKFQTSEEISYCSTCSEYMCTSCDKAHRGSKATRDHNILKGSNVPSASTTTKPTSSIMLCKYHNTMIVDMYCTSHDVVICSACRITSHKTCKITDFRQETKQMKRDGSFKKTRTILEDLKSQCDKMKAMKKKDKSRFKSQIEKCRKDMHQLRKDINETLDSIEITLSKEIQHADETITKDIACHTAILDGILFQIMEQLKHLKSSEKAQDDQIMFVEMKRASIARHNYAETLDKMEEDINESESQFKINDTLFDTMRQLQSIETVLLDRQDIKGSIAYGRQKSVSDMSISGRRDINTKDTHIVGCTFMPDGNLVLCCGENGIKFLDNEYKIKSQLNARAWDVAAINDNEIIVTQGYDEQIQKVTIFPQMKVSTTIKMDRNCYGVDVFGGYIFVTCRNLDGGNGEVRVLNMDGNVQRRLGLNNGKYMFKRPGYVTVNNDGSKVFVSDSGTHTVTCLDTQGDVIYQYSDPGLKEPQGMFVDCEGTLLVCGYSSNNVHVIGQDGRKEKIFLSKADGKMRPHCIAFRPSDSCLVVGIYNAKNKSLISFTAK